MPNPRFQKLLQREMTRTEFLAFSAFAVASVFGIVGLIRELASRAATPTANIEPEDSTVAAPATVITDATASGGQAIKFGTTTPAAFVLGVTKPKLADPDNPTAADNVGAAFGWNGVTLTVMNGDQTIPANTTWTNKLIHGYVVFTDSTSKLVNSVVDGRAKGGAFQSGLVNGSKGGQLDRCTIRATATSATNYLNGITSTGGNWTINRCDISRVVDSVHANNSGWIKLTGCRLHDYSFWDNDPAHDDDTKHPYWSHGDVGIQRLSGSGSGDWLEGNSIQGFFDTTGVTWSGGTWGSGTASGGTIGTPKTALNGGYPNRNYANLISYTNVAPYTGMTFLNNWLNGGSYPSGMLQVTESGAHKFHLEGNRYALGGQPSSTKKIFLCSYSSSSVVTFGTAPNIYDTTSDTPTSLQGKSLTFTNSGASVVLP